MSTMHKEIASEFGAFSLSEDCTMVSVNYGELTNLISRCRVAENKLMERMKECDSIGSELKTLRSLFAEKNRKVEELGEELLFLRGFQEAVHLMCGAKKPY